MPLGLTIRVAVFLAASAAAANANILSPVLDDRLYAGSQQVHVTSLKSGTTVAVAAGQSSQPIGRLVVQGGEATIQLDRPLNAGEQITATATLGSDEAISQPVTVMVALDPLPTPKPVAGPTLYLTSRCMATSGAAPGSTSQATGQGGDLGKGVSNHDGLALLRFPTALPSQDQVTLSAELGGKTSGKSVPPIGVIPYVGPTPYQEQLLSPTVDPLVACSDRIPLGRLLPGSELEVQADGQTVAGPSCNSFSGGVLKIGETLRAGSQVVASQIFPDLPMPKASSKPQTVTDIGPPPPPRINDPLYADQYEIPISGILNSASIEIEVDGSSQGEADFGGQFRLNDALRAGSSVRVRQKLCQWGDWSDPVIVRGREEVQPVTVNAPLYECVDGVGVADWEEGAEVRIFAERAGGNDQRLGRDYSDTVSVAPHLMAGQKIFATQAKGSVESAKSASVTVLATPDVLPKPKLSAIGYDHRVSAQGANYGNIWKLDYSKTQTNFTPACAPAVLVENVLPGATVSVFAKQALIATAVATSREIYVPIDVADIDLGWELVAIQSLCTTQSPPSDMLELGNDLGVAHERFVDVSQGAVTRGATFELMCPAHTDLTFSLEVAGTSDVAETVSTQFAVKDGQTEGTAVQYKAKAPGKAYVSPKTPSQLAPFAYINTAHGDIVVQAYGKIWFEDDGKKLTDGEEIEIESGKTKTLRVYVNPVPKDRIIQLKTYGTGQSALSFPTDITVPQGQSFANLPITGKQPGLGWINEEMDYYALGIAPEKLEGEHLSVKVKVAKAAPPEPEAPKTAGIVLFYEFDCVGDVSNTTVQFDGKLVSSSDPSSPGQTQFYDQSGVSKTLSECTADVIVNDLQPGIWQLSGKHGLGYLGTCKRNIYKGIINKAVLEPNKTVCTP